MKNRYWKLTNSSVARIIDLYKETGGVKPKERSYGPKPIISGEKLDEMLGYAGKNKNATLEGIKRALSIDACIMTIANALRASGYTYKKKRWHATGSSKGVSS